MNLRRPGVAAVGRIIICSGYPGKPGKPMFIDKSPWEVFPWRDFENKSPWRICASSTDRSFPPSSLPSIRVPVWRPHVQPECAAVPRFERSLSQEPGQTATGSGQSVPEAPANIARCLIIHTSQFLWVSWLNRSKHARTCAGNRRATKCVIRDA